MVKNFRHQLHRLHRRAIAEGDAFGVVAVVVHDGNRARIEIGFQPKLISMRSQSDPLLQNDCVSQRRYELLSTVQDGCRVFSTDGEVLVAHLIIAAQDEGFSCGEDVGVGLKFEMTVLRYNEALNEFFSNDQKQMKRGMIGGESTKCESVIPFFHAIFFVLFSTSRAHETHRHVRMFDPRRLHPHKLPSRAANLVIVEEAARLESAAVDEKVELRAQLLRARHIALVKHGVVLKQFLLQIRHVVAALDEEGVKDEGRFVARRNAHSGEVVGAHLPHVDGVALEEVELERASLHEQHEGKEGDAGLVGFVREGQFVEMVEGSLEPTVQAIRVGGESGVRVREKVASGTEAGGSLAKFLANQSDLRFRKSLL